MEIKENMLKLRKGLDTVESLSAGARGSKNLGKKNSSTVAGTKSRAFLYHVLILLKYF